MSDKFLEVVPDRVYLDMLGTHTNLAVIGGRGDVVESDNHTMWVSLDSQYKEVKADDPAGEVRALRDALNFILKEQYGED
jgi:hypothetical protein